MEEFSPLQIGIYFGNILVMRTIVHQMYNFLSTNSYKLPLFLSPVKAGFPSPADDFVETQLDLNHYLVKHPTSTFFMRSSVNEETESIYSGDILVVDRSINPKEGSLIVAVVNGEFQIQRIMQKNNMLSLFHHPTVEFQVWGVITYVIHKT